MATTYYEVKVCPYAEECNARNFAGWKCWGCSPEEARAKVVDHLLGCGLHKEYAKEDPTRDRAFYELMVESTEVVEKTWPEPAQPKRRRDAAPSTPPDGPQTLQLQVRDRGDASNRGLALATRSSAVAARLTNMEYKSITDACVRASKAARNAQRLSAAAASAFAEEAAVFEDIAEYMKETKGHGSSSSHN